ncbi:hypothetical protein SAMN05892877_1093 [Rhizobium subbaraonis]|uniref:Uncharacterized protein n=1 Tax=Rhizobium subbaraonis TaxID=908946 RepID=A0A285UJH8_9HYPH|nr:hypothetical protein [Rhizobium subbaraonis]SOC41558.1 hypothetical protein SAMN05892877_1093 [Rhizobium subbaraonis]
MFKIVKTLTTWWPVKVFEPDPDPENVGKFAEYSFDIQFEILDRDQSDELTRERNAILDIVKDSTAEDKLRELERRLEEHNIKSFQRTIRNWRGVLDDDGKAFPFTNENLLIALKRNSFREAVNAAYAEAIDSGKARLGN